MTALTAAELARYARHLTLDQVGVRGQERLRDARVLIVGLGGLGSPVAIYLAAAGVGTLGLVDFDRVDESNLQRQVLHGTDSVGMSKVESAMARLRDVNPHVRLESVPEGLTHENAVATISRFDLVVDGTDNFATRYLVNDACVGRPALATTNRMRVRSSSVGRSTTSRERFSASPLPYPRPAPGSDSSSAAESGVESFRITSGVYSSARSSTWSGRTPRSPR